MSERRVGRLGPTLELDCRGLFCPLPALRTEKALTRLAPGELLRVLCTDPAARIDLSALCERAAAELVRIEERDDELVFWIRRLAES